MALRGFMEPNGSQATPIPHHSHGPSLHSARPTHSSISQIALRAAPVAPGTSLAGMDKTQRGCVSYKGPRHPHQAAAPLLRLGARVAAVRAFGGSTSPQDGASAPRSDIAAAAGVPELQVSPLGIKMQRRASSDGSPARTWSGSAPSTAASARCALEASDQPLLGGQTIAPTKSNTLRTTRCAHTHPLLLDGVPTEAGDQCVQSVRRRRGVLLAEAWPANDRRERARNANRNFVPPPGTLGLHSTELKISQAELKISQAGSAQARHLPPVRPLPPVTPTSCDPCSNPPRASPHTHTHTHHHHHHPPSPP